MLGLPGLTERDFTNLFRLDDINPEIISYLGEKLQKLSVLDFQATPVVMKKGRIGHNLTVLTEPALAARAMAIIFHEPTTLGIRRSRVKRTCRQRESVEVVFWGINYRRCWSMKIVLGG